jgi:hypothetical protein
MKKSIKIALGTTLALGVFATGFFGKEIYTKASGDWSTNAENTAYSELIGTANTTKNDLVSNINSDVSNKINTAIAGTVDEQQAELQKLLDQYYQMKLNGLTSTPEFLALDKKIKDIQASVLAAFKQQIDQEFANQVKPQQ